MYSRDSSSCALGVKVEHGFRKSVSERCLHASIVTYMLLWHFCYSLRLYLFAVTVHIIENFLLLRLFLVELFCFDVVVHCGLINNEYS